MFKFPGKIINLCSKAISPSKVLQTFPLQSFQQLENTSIHKFTPYTDINAKFNTQFDSQIILVANDKNHPQYSNQFFQTEHFKTAHYKNKFDNKISPLVVGEQKLVIAVVDVDAENLSYPKLQLLFHSALSSSFLSAVEKGYKRPLVEYMNGGLQLRTAEVEGMVDASLSNLSIYPTFVCPTHEKLFIDKLIKSGSIVLRVEALIVVSVIAIILALIFGNSDDDKSTNHLSSLKSGESVVNHQKILHEGMNDRITQKNDQSWVSTVFTRFFS